VFHLSQLGSSDLDQHSLLVDAVLQVVDDMPDLLGCHASIVSSRIVRISDRWVRMGVVFF
jgi:hypothetical protein